VRPKTIEKLTSDLAIFGEYRSEYHGVRSIADLERRQVEGFLAWTAKRACGAATMPAVGSVVTRTHTPPSSCAGSSTTSPRGDGPTPRRRLAFATDIPGRPEALPRALPSDVDGALSHAAPGRKPAGSVDRC
jgi:hypothetical protein